MLNIRQSISAISKNMDTVIGEGIVFEDASVKGSGVIRIDGSFSGTINFDGHIILGETGTMSGDILAESALLAGKAHGNLYIRGALHMTPSSTITGKVEAGKLIIDEGAVLNGACNVIKDFSQAMIPEKIATPAPAKRAPRKERQSEVIKIDEKLSNE